MTPREEIKALLTAACPDWTVTYEAGRLMNLTAQQLSSGAKFIYIEEFATGKYLRPTGRPAGKMTRMQISFCKFKLDAEENTRDRAGSPDAPAEHRELVREQIESQAVNPFLEAFTLSAAFLNKPTEIPFAYPLPRFSDREISVMLEIEVQVNGTC